MTTRRGLLLGRDSAVEPARGPFPLTLSIWQVQAFLEQSHNPLRVVLAKRTHFFGARNTAESLKLPHFTNVSHSC